MTDPNDPAFVGIVDNTLQYVPGMTKREEFAKAAMQGILSNSSQLMVMAQACDGDPDKAAKAVATWAVLQADALIAELNKK